MQDQSVDNGRESRMSAWLQSQSTCDLIKGAERMKRGSDMQDEISRELGRRGK